MKILAKSKTVLVGVLKTRRDQEILLKEHWYRIPVLHLPKQNFKYIAFYQPLGFGKQGKRIEYYARVSKISISKRVNLLPYESEHPRAMDDYKQFEFKKIKKLSKPIRNIIPRRISFGFTSLKTLLSARDILQLYSVLPTERIILKALERFGIRPITEYTVSAQGRRYRLDLALFCRQGRIAIECDNLKAHSSKTQIQKDKIKDHFLKSIGWHVIRLAEKNIVENLHSCTARILKTIKNLDNLKSSQKVIHLTQKI